METFSMVDRCPVLHPAHVSRPNAIGQSSGNDTNAWFSLFRVQSDIKPSEESREREV